MQITLFARTGIQEPDFELTMDSTLSAYYTPKPILSAHDLSPSSSSAATATSISEVDEAELGEERETTPTERTTTTD